MDPTAAETLVRLAMAQGALAAARGDAPFGAVLATPAGDVLLEAANAQRTETDPTAHSEMQLLRAAARELGLAALDGLVVATNAEPCSMCASALVKARVATIVYGAPREPHVDPDIGLAQVVAQSRHSVEVMGSILADECAAAIAAARAEAPAVD